MISLSDCIQHQVPFDVSKTLSIFPLPAPRTDFLGKSFSLTSFLCGFFKVSSSNAVRFNIVSLESMTVIEDDSQSDSSQ